MLKRIAESGAIFWAYSDREWTLDGAAVQVSMVGFDDNSETSRELDGLKRIGDIHEPALRRDGCDEGSAA